jgi:hypothetical protein
MHAICNFYYKYANEKISVPHRGDCRFQSPHAVHAGRILAGRLRRFRGTGLAAACAALTACAISTGAPEQPTFMDADAEALRKEYGESAIARAQKLRSAEAKRQYRNEMIEARTVLIDRRFYAWARNLLREEAGKNLAVDTAVIALNTTGTLTGGALVKSILSAVSAGIVGIKGSFDKNAYYEKTIVALLLKMEAEREKIKLAMAQKASQSIADYTITGAISDLERLYTAGTLRGALISITEEAGKDASQAKTLRRQFLIDSRHDTAFLDAQKEVAALRTAIDGLSDTQAIKLGGQIPYATDRIRRMVEARDPRNRRLTDGKFAKRILRRRISMEPRTAERFRAWRAAMARVK